MEAGVVQLFTAGKEEKAFEKQEHRDLAVACKFTSRKSELGICSDGAFICVSASVTQRAFVSSVDRSAFSASAAKLSENTKKRHNHMQSKP